MVIPLDLQVGAVTHWNLIREVEIQTEGDKFSLSLSLSILVDGVSWYHF